MKAVGEGVKGGFSRASSSWANSNGIWLASLDGWRVWFSCSRACDNRSVFDSSVFSSLTFEWKRWKTGRALLTRGTCFLPQIDQDGLTLPERTLYLAQDEESEKVPRQRLGFWEGKSLRRRVAGGGRCLPPHNKLVFWCRSWPHTGCSWSVYSDYWEPMRWSRRRRRSFSWNRGWPM